MIDDFFKFLADNKDDSKTITELRLKLIDYCCKDIEQWETDAECLENEKDKTKMIEFISCARLYKDWKESTHKNG